MIFRYNLPTDYLKIRLVFLVQVGFYCILEVPSAFLLTQYQKGDPMSWRTSIRTVKYILVPLISILMVCGVVQNAQAILMNRKLSGDIVSGGSVDIFHISRDGQRVIFFGDLRTNDIREVFSVPTMGGERVMLNAPLSGDLYVNQALISPNSQQVVYLVNTPDQSHGLYAVPIGGGTPRTLIDGLPEGTWIQKISFSSDSEHVFFLKVIPSTDAHPERDVYLYTVSIDAGTPVQLSDSMEYIDYHPVPNAPNVVYLTRHMGTPNHLIFSDLAGTQEYDEIDVTSFDITPDGQHIIFLKMDTSPIDELYSLPITGGTPKKLNNPLVADGSVFDFKISPNSEYVVYNADALLDGKKELFSAEVGRTGTSVKLIQPMIPAGDVSGYLITPNSQGVVYLADQLVDERVELGSVPITGGTNNWLNGPMIPEGDVYDFEITPNSYGVVFSADKYVNHQLDLFAVTIIGTGLVKLNPDLPTWGSVYSFKISPNNLGVVYDADHGDIDEQWELYLSASDGTGDVIKINGPLVPNGDTKQYAISPDNKGVVYIADQEQDGVDELFVTYDYQPVYLPLITK